MPFIIAGAVVVAWSGLWVYARGEAGKRLEAGAEQLRKAGYDVTWGKQRIYGYPFRLNIQLDDARIREPSGAAITQVDRPCMKAWPSSFDAASAQPDGSRMRASSSWMFRRKG